MAERTLAQKIEDNDAAIEAIETGAQSYSIAGRTYTRADLATLYKQADRLAAKAARAASGNRTRAEF